jgi:hypothetical protein
MRMRTLVVILLAGTIGFLAGRGPVHPLRAWVPLFAVSSPAAGPTEALPGDNREPAPCVSLHAWPHALVAQGEAARLPSRG